MKGVIIGGGIGGLTLAAAMNQLELPFIVYEAAPQIQELGAGILLGTNAMLVLKALKLDQKVKAAGKVLRDGRITNSKYKILQNIPLKIMEEKYGISSVIIHRGKLQRILLDSIPSSRVKTGYRAISILEGEQPIVKFANTQLETCDYVIAADGIHSAIRTQLFPNKTPRYSGQTCWRGILKYKLPGRFKNIATEAWGKKGRFGFTEISDDLVYWYAVKKATEGEKDSLEFLTNELLDIFVDFEEPVRDLLLSTKLSNIIRNDLYDLEPKRNWYKGNICLLGDAIHATTPNLGQGGAQAIEDGLALARCLKNTSHLNEAFKQYESLRYPKASFVIRQSRRFGQIAHLENSFLIGIRNSIMPFLPQKALMRQFEKLYLINY